MGRNKNKRRKKKARKWRTREEHKGDSGAPASIIRGKLQAAAPDMSAKIDKTIQRLLEIGRQFNPFPISQP